MARISGPAPYEQGDEFGGLGWPQKIAPEALAVRFKGQPAPATATTIAMVATDATLTKAECKRLAIMANDGLSKALRPVHAPNDGDTVFAAATGQAGPPGGDPPVLTELGTVAADCLARAVARGVYEATALPYKTAVPDLEDALRRRPAMMGYLVVFVGAGVGGAIRHGMNIWVARLARHALSLAHLRRSTSWARW